VAAQAGRRHADPCAGPVHHPSDSDSNRCGAPASL